MLLRLLEEDFQWPRAGRNNDQAHPPIHPVTFVAASSLENDQQRRVYEFVVRRFLACCSEDAKGESTTVEMEYGDESFHSGGLIVRERNYLDIYPYEKWESSQAMPDFAVGERFEPTEAKISEGKTVAPGYLTEPDLIALMDANGIGTDATMAEHIAKIKARNYVTTRPRGGGQVEAEEEDDASRGSSSSRGSRGQGRGRGRGGASNSSSSRSSTNSGMQEFIPTTLGVALIEGYDKMNFATSLSKPFLRKEVR
jgi:DNA topoisomerase-3